MTFVPLKNILSGHLKRDGIGRQITAAIVVEKFNQILVEIFGENILKRARAAFFKNKVLTVNCLSSVLAQEIYLKRNKIIRELNKRFGQEVVENLKFRM
jgi:predicted nucleic acid-binding Zn ribbon protein